MLKNVTDLVKGDVVLERGRRFTVRNISVSDSDRNVYVYSTRGELATYELTDDVEVVGSTREGQRDIGPKVKDTYKPKGYTSEELEDIERQLDAMKLKLADLASGGRQIRLTVLGKPLTVYAIRWDAATREQIRTRTSEVYFHFDEKLGRLELREAQSHGETLWMKKVHKPGELRRAHYAAENFIRTQGVRVVEQQSWDVNSFVLPANRNEASIALNRLSQGQLSLLSKKLRVSVGSNSRKQNLITQILWQFFDASDELERIRTYKEPVSKSTEANRDADRIATQILKRIRKGEAAETITSAAPNTINARQVAEVYLKGRMRFVDYKGYVLWPAQDEEGYYVEITDRDGAEEDIPLKSFPTTGQALAAAKFYVDEKASKAEPKDASELMTESIQSVVANEIHRAQESLNV